MSRTLWVWVWVLFFAVTTAEGRPAHKNSSSSPLDDVSVSTLVREAERLYSVGRFKDAALLLEKAQSREANPIFVYNIARAWEQQGEMDRALEFYQRYLSFPDDTEPSLLKRAALSVDRIKAMHSKVEQERRAKEMDERALHIKELAAQDSLSHPTPEESEARKRAEEEQADSTATRQIFSFMTGGVAGAGIGAGVVLFLASRTSATAGLQQQANTQVLWSAISAGVGVGALVTSILIYPRAPPKKAEAAAPAKPELHVLLSPFGAGASVRF